MRFFRKAIRKGMPWSTKGIADGLSGLAHAVENISIAGGRVTWSSDNVPKLIPGSVGGAAGALMSHHLRIATVEVEGGEEGETEQQLQVFADGPLWQDGDDTYSTMNTTANPLVDVGGKWHEVATAADGTIYSWLRSDGDVEVGYTLPTAREDYIKARAIGVIADGKIRQVAEGLLWTRITVKDPGLAVQTMPLLGSGEDTETALTDTWEANGTDGLEVWKVVRSVYNDAQSEPVLYAFLRKFTYGTDGRLFSVSGETRAVVDEPVDLETLVLPPEDVVTSALVKTRLSGFVDTDWSDISGTPDNGFCDAVNNCIP